jgi:hypothetical protein
VRDFSLLAAAAVFALLIVVFVVSLRLVRRALRRGTGAGPTTSPKTIRLRRADDVPLKDPVGVELLARPLLDRGFTDAGIWLVEELGLLVRFLLAPDDGLYAVIYDRAKVAGTWLDLVTLYADGTSLTVNNLVLPSALDDRPGHRKVCGAKDANGVYETMLRERGRDGKPPLRLAPPALPALFAKAYADEIAWRDARGGPTEAEIRRIAAASGKTLTNEQVKAAKEMLEEQARKRRG